MEKPYIVVKELRVLPDMEKGTRLAKAIMLEKGIVPGQGAFMNDLGCQSVRDYLGKAVIHCHKPEAAELFRRKCFITFCHQKVMKDYVQGEHSRGFRPEILRP
jgi:hypothetical protein